MVNGRHYDPSNQAFVGVGPASASVSNPYLGNPFETGPGDFSLETNVLRRTFGWNQDEAVQFEKRLPGVRTRLFGGLNAVIGFAGMLTATLAGPLAPAAFLVSFDLFVSGMAQAITGEEQDTAVARGTKAVARELGASPEEAGEIAFAVELGLGFINPTRAAAAGATRVVARSGLRAAVGSGLRGASRAAVELMSRAARSTRQIINAAKSSRVAEALTATWERTRLILTMCLNKCFVAGTLVTVLAAGVDLDEANAALAEAHAIDAETGDSYATEAALAEYTALEPIEEIATGDYVLSRPEDDLDAALVFERVEMTSAVPTDTIVEITVRDERTGKIETIGTTDLHPFWLEAAPEADPAPLCDLTTDELAGNAAYLTHNVNAPTRAGPATDQWRHQWPTATERAPHSVPAASIPPTPGDPRIVHGTRGWVYARDLHAGHHLRTADGRTLTVLHVATKAAPQPVYNFRVQSTHTYHVGAAGVLTHNTADPDKCLTLMLRNILRRRGGFPKNHAGNAVADALPGGALRVRRVVDKRQIHHIATVEDELFRVEFEEIFEGASLSLQSAFNKVKVAGHVGPHGYYNQHVLDRLRTAVKNRPPGSRQYREALTEELLKLRYDIKYNGLDALLTAPASRAERRLVR